MLIGKRLWLWAVVVAGLALARLILLSGSASFGQVASEANKSQEIGASDTPSRMGQVESDTPLS